MKLPAALVFGLATLLAGNSHAARYVLDPARSYVEFEIVRSEQRFDIPAPEEGSTMWQANRVLLRSPVAGWLDAEREQSFFNPEIWRTYLGSRQLDLGDAPAIAWVWQEYLFMDGDSTLRDTPRAWALAVEKEADGFYVFPPGWTCLCIQYPFVPDYIDAIESGSITSTSISLSMDVIYGRDEWDKEGLIYSLRPGDVLLPDGFWLPLWADTGRITRIVMVGEVSTVPEAGPMAAWSLGGLVLAATLRRRTRGR